MTNIADTLKSDSLEEHREVEKLLVNRIRNIFTISDYISLLQIFYTYFGALEKSIEKIISLKDLPDFNSRRKTDALAKDLLDLGATPRAMAPSDNLPLLSNQKAALGALYVIEGSTLGGGVIRKMIVRQVELPHGLGLSFFTGYGEQTESMWAGFKSALNASSINADDNRIVTDAVISTFRKFKLWIEQHG